MNTKERNLLPFPPALKRGWDSLTLKPKTHQETKKKTKNESSESNQLKSQG